jgi:D-glycero-alpha-D-manno-heptose-7-phosphate kinase
MILTKTPFRISFAGGGSDLPGFYRRRTGVVVSTTIDKSMYIAIHPYFHDKIRIKYSRTEDVSSAAEVEHPLVRECLQMVGIERGMEIASFADVPAGTGMGSSSAFTVGLLHALQELAGVKPTALELAAAACHVELERVAEPIGKQDQYAVACGGMNCIRFNSDESVEVHPVVCSAETRHAIERRVMLFYIGQERPASSILSEQSRNMVDSEKFSRVTRMAALAEDLCTELERNDISSFGEILHQGWLLKSGVAQGITNEVVESNYRLAREAGAAGGKLLGAGGGGFLLLYCEPGKQPQVRAALAHLREMSFAMTQEGSQVLHNDGQNRAILARSEALSAKNN